MFIRAFTATELNSFCFMLAANSASCSALRGADRESSALPLSISG